MDRLFDLVEEIFEIGRDDYSEETVINEIKTWDSLKYMEFVVSIEESFQIKLTGDEIAALRTIKDVKDQLVKKGIDEYSKSQKLDCVT